MKGRFSSLLVIAGSGLLGASMSAAPSWLAGFPPEIPIAREFIPPPPDSLRLEPTLPHALPSILLFIQGWENRLQREDTGYEFPLITPLNRERASIESFPDQKEVLTPIRWPVGSIELGGL